MKPPSEMTTEELAPYAREWMRRTRTPPDRSKLAPCIHCGKPLNATQRRKKCVWCGGKATRGKIAQ